MAELRAAYRQLRRLVGRVVVPAGSRPAWRRNLRVAFSEEPQEGAPGLAQEYAALVEAVVHQKELLASYNIGVDRTDEQRRAVRSVAARVGLQVPEWEDR